MPEKSEALFDKRIVQRNIKRGRITRREYDAFVKHLDDVTDKSEPLFSEEMEEELIGGREEAS